jgi:2-polyprenyl-3-methyl-5-hydroxy-6-metoxy-1,4-benzoquinol methylase
MDRTEKLKSLESQFYEYMHRQGQVDAAANRRTLDFYVPYFASCRHVLDVGCGEGQFLEALTAAGVRTSGIDLDPRVVQACRSRGLDAEEISLFNHLPQNRGQFDGVFCSNLIEHLPMAETIRFLEMAFDALLPGGILLVATPNPESLVVHLCEFWRDATHVRLYNRSLLEFLLAWAGFEELQSGENPTTAWAAPADWQEVPQLLESLPAWGGIPQWQGAIDARMQQPKRSALRRLAFSLRRRVARFLTQTVLFEEFAQLTSQTRALSAHMAEVTDELNHLERDFTTWRAVAQRVGSTLYQTQSHFLVAPREVFALGIKPSASCEETP